ncbi:peptidoglycan-binding protein [Serratia proteamaculans]|uniref:peptidoglycan-binding domain-containing protein n=1 Tax=Serratia proteamaculans TaxID=28151 RepID=UPI001076B851|nr:peptidoglycan-binding domain-containing protein [Serratia proteamaculans]TFZ50923.1 peptidoglycan-binding protein [Serratia proteamaculans]
MAQNDYTQYAKDELTLNESIKKGNKSNDAKRIQEWLTFNHQQVVIDGEFGPATEQAVKNFQKTLGLNENGIVDPLTWKMLTRPMQNALAGIGNTQSFGDALKVIATQHLNQHPIEIGGENRGPWVRLYMQGAEGEDQLWCAGFVSFILQQTRDNLGLQVMPIAGSQSCDILAKQAKQKGRLVPAELFASRQKRWQEMGQIQLFLVRSDKSDQDWVHTGFSFNGHDSLFSTIEGNTDHQGSANGYEVCSKIRNISNKDFISLL